MKISIFLLAASLSANLALLGFVALQSHLPAVTWRDLWRTEAERKAEIAADNRAAKEAVEARARDLRTRRAGLWEELQARDLKTLVEQLRAAGFPANIIRALVDAKLEATYGARIRALLGEAHDRPFWQPESVFSSNDTKFFEALNAIHKERSKALREILGDELLAAAGADLPEQLRQRFGNLPKAKLDLVRRIADDYDEMIRQAKNGSRDIQLPEDKATLELLERERRADLAAVLTAAELEDYEMRNSPLLGRLRQPLTFMDASEAEFRAIYLALLPVADSLFPSAQSYRLSTPQSRQEREAAHQSFVQRLQAELGEARTAEYLRASNSDYQQVRRITDAAALPVETANRIYDLRTTTLQESLRIHGSGLDATERSAALQVLASQARAQVTGQLGNAAASYLRDANWILALERGYAISLSPDGRAQTYLGSRTTGPASGGGKK